jgi:tetratricopeptide (TPR) repeat protein
MRLFAIFPTCLSVLLLGGTAPAQSSEAQPNLAPAAAELPPLAESLKGEAKAEYAAARILFEDGDYAGAITKLSKAHQLSADPRFLWNLAVAEKNLRHYSKVIDYVGRFLAAGAPYVTAADKTQAEELLLAVRDFVSEVTIETDPSGVTVEVDGQDVGTTPLSAPLSLDLGHRTLRLAKAGYRNEERSLKLEGGKPARISFALTKDVHEGTLKIITDPQTRIRVDGKLAGTGLWQGAVPSGAHAIQLEGDKKVPQTTEVVLVDGESRTINIQLLSETAERSKGIPTWVWVTGGIAAAGLGTGAYFLFRSRSERPPIQEGTWSTLEF